MRFGKYSTIRFTDCRFIYSPIGLGVLLTDKFRIGTTDMDLRLAFLAPPVTESLRLNDEVVDKRDDSNQFDSSASRLEEEEELCGGCGGNNADGFVLSLLCSCCCSSCCFRSRYLSMADNPSKDATIEDCPEDGGRGKDGGALLPYRGWTFGGSSILLALL